MLVMSIGDGLDRDERAGCTGGWTNAHEEGRGPRRSAGDWTRDVDSDRRMGGPVDPGLRATGCRHLLRPSDGSRAMRTAGWVCGPVVQRLVEAVDPGRRVIEVPTRGESGHSAVEDDRSCRPRKERTGAIPSRHPRCGVPGLDLRGLQRLEWGLVFRECGLCVTVASGDGFSPTLVATQPALVKGSRSEEGIVRYVVA